MLIRIASAVPMQTANCDSPACVEFRKLPRTPERDKFWYSSKSAWLPTTPWHRDRPFKHPGRLLPAPERGNTDILTSTGFGDIWRVQYRQRYSHIYLPLCSA